MCMQSVARQSRLGSKAFVASLLTGLVLLLEALAVSPHAHENLHHDANSGHHQCAVTIFEQGQVEATSFEVASQPPAEVATYIPAAVFSVYSPAIANLPAGRAPPVASANS